MPVINEAGQGPWPVGLSQQAQEVYRCLAAAGGSVPCEVVAALAYLPVPLTYRHLRHLVRVGLATGAGGRYMTAPDAPPPPRADVDEQAWGRAVGWYAACAFNAARVLGSAALPGGEVIAGAGTWPVPHFEGAARAAGWYAVSHGELAWAVDRAVAVGDDGHGWRLALLVGNIAAATGPVGAWERVLEAGLAAAEREGHADAAGLILEHSGKLLLATGRLEAAVAAQAEAVGVRSGAGDKAGMIRSTNALGLIALRKQDYPVASTYFAGALEMALKAGDREFTAFARMNLGAVLSRDGDTAGAKPLLEAAAAYQREQELGYYLANTLQDLAACHRIEGDHQQAHVTAVKAVDEATRAQLPMYLAGPLCELARAQLALGDQDAALAGFAEARAIHAELGDPVRAGAITREIAQIHASEAAASTDGVGR
jgi:tetratricopeptide (TPR) repeat protein